jgi:L-lactate dehydrogenase complex protein LldF
MKAAAWVLSDPRRLAGAQRAATMAGRFTAGRTIRSVPGLSAWTNARDVPTPPTETFRQWWARERRTGGAK